MLHDVIIIIVCMHPQAIMLPTMTMRKAIHGFLWVWSSSRRPFRPLELSYCKWNPEPLKVWPTVEYVITCRMCHKTVQSNSTIQENKNLPHTQLTCSFQTCLITERVASFQHKDDFSSAMSFSAGRLALAADLLKVSLYMRFAVNFYFVNTYIKFNTKQHSHIVF